MRPKLIAAIAAAAAASTFMTGGVSHADVSPAWNAGDVPGSPPAGLPCATDSLGTKACYQRNGDVMWVKDSRADGAWSEMLVFWYGSARPIGKCEDHLGPAVGWTRCIYNIEPETNRIFFYAQTRNSSGFIGTPSPTVVTWP